MALAIQAERMKLEEDRTNAREYNSLLSTNNSVRDTVPHHLRFKHTNVLQDSRLHRTTIFHVELSKPGPVVCF